MVLFFVVFFWKNKVKIRKNSNVWNVVGRFDEIIGGDGDPSTGIPRAS